MKTFCNNIFVFLLFIFLLLLVASCKILKQKQSIVKDTTAKHAVDSGSVKNNSGTAKDETKWWKETVVYAKDTTKGNVTNVYPTTIIREAGTNNKEATYSNHDSSWKQAIDSIRATLQQQSKSKEEKALNIWQILGLCAAAYFVLMALGKTISFNNPFKKV